MRLHTLTLRAVGPFADEQVVDFDRLGAGGLFLFEGPTGVGKSTILDAITFALYGGLASATSDPHRIHSDFVGPEVRPVVTLEFSVRGSRYRVTRTPAYTRIKQRGSGTTEESASVHLERHEAGGWSSQSHNKAEVAAIVGDLLGLTQEQFRKVVLLPQGEFAAFLVADEKTRADILTTLFGTEIYDRVTRELQGRATAARAELREATGKVRSRCAAAWEAAGTAPEPSEPPLALTAEVALLQELSEPIEAVRGRAVAAAVAASATERAAAAGLRAAGERLDAVRRLGGLLTRRSTIEVGRAEQETRVARAALARQALPGRPLLSQLDERVRQVMAALAAAVTLGVSDAEHLEGCGHQALADQAAAAREAAARLGSAAELESGLTAAAQKVVALELEQAEASADLSAVVEALESIPAAAVAAREQAQQARTTAARRELLTERVTAAGELLERMDQVATLTLTVAQAQGAHREAAKAFQVVEDEVRLLEDHRLESLSGVLAGRLVSGDPCMVCGSAEHPSPAAGRAGQVTEEHVRARMAVRDEARIVLDQAQLTLVTSQAALSALRGGLGITTGSEVQADLVALERELAEATAAGELVRELESRADELDGRATGLAQQQIALVARVTTLTEQLRTAHAGLERDRSSVAKARGQHISVAERIANLLAQAETQQASAEAVRALGAAIAEQRNAQLLVVTEADLLGFADEAAMRAAFLPAEELAALEQESKEWQAGLDEVLALLAAPDLVAVADVREADAAQAEQEAAVAHRVAQEAARVAHGTAATEQQRAKRFAARLAEVLDEAVAREALAAQADEVIALDELARGQAGSPRMPLVHYVLRYWFEQVVEAANVRLGVMSTGKYQLLRTDVGSRKDSKVGLGLAVLDRHTGRERSPASLSGGERFYVSLSLALGLADVVVAQAGGADLDTLFIDEGFGTLDADTLESVMGVIDDLRGNGRVIGIVSHVPDLKERVPERLSVRRASPEGPSQVKVVA